MNRLLKRLVFLALGLILLVALNALSYYAPDIREWAGRLSRLEAYGNRELERHRLISRPVVDCDAEAGLQLGRVTRVTQPARHARAATLAGAWAVGAGPCGMHRLRSPVSPTSYPQGHPLLHML